ncbi:cytosolic Fe-S cluster assembly factor NUBP2-like [Lethenteron reissneri]|uniref:cytosolic Fe-S cluster assembly factor NUBP2-like n=1 Tax=Lethenteron reissneri TaxID=7753 RepID=UPI002AB5ED60|nr:cytosolic Fe-S cluster assembly factor NUBP2-like [Lethenteron reissneri]
MEAHVDDSGRGDTVAGRDEGGLSGVRSVVLVLSGKGGVGKSTVSTQLALALRNAGQKVGLLDVDLCGPSVPRMLGLQGRAVHQCAAGWLPVYADAGRRLAVMSVSFLLAQADDAVVWRGPKKNAMIKQFVSDVLWGELDFLLVDTPPGTSDEHMAVLESLRGRSPAGALLVTTPQEVSVGDVRRELTFCSKTGLKVLGIIENMSGFVCPHCSECSNVFSKGGGEALADEFKVPFLGCVPVELQLARCGEDGRSLLEASPESGAHQILQAIAQRLIIDHGGDGGGVTASVAVP